MLEIIPVFRKLQLWATGKNTVETYKTKESYFTRGTAKLTFEKLFSFIIGNNKNSAQIAINNFFKKTKKEPVAKQTLFEAREKISPDAFKDFNLIIVDDFYKEPDTKTYKGYFLYAVDGSVYQLPQGALEKFGGKQSSNENVISAQGRALCVNDVLNKIVVASSFKPISHGEREMFQSVFEETPNTEHSCFVFDRGFYSKKLCDFLNEKGAKYLFRVKANKCQKDINKAEKTDQTINVNGGLKLRVINVVLSTGETEKLATNIFDANFTVSDFEKIYNKRWGIETAYLMMKERLSVENFTSAKESLILQDFYAAVLTYNLMEIACMEQEKKRLNDGVDEDCKNLKSANRNIASHEIRECLFAFFNTCDFNDVTILLLNMQKIIYRFFKEIRPDRSFQHKVICPNKKFPMNKKRNA